VSKAKKDVDTTAQEILNIMDSLIDVVGKILEDKKGKK